MACSQAQFSSERITSISGITNRLFFFASYEGRRDAAAVSSVRTVPNVDFRNGIIRYRTQNGVLRALSASEFRSLDPAGLGPSPAMLDLLRRFPNPNDFSSGDGLNTAGFRSNAPITVNWNTALLRLDWNNPAIKAYSGAPTCRITAQKTTPSSRDSHPG